MEVEEYQRVNWNSSTTFLNPENLNTMDKGIKSNNEMINELNDFLKDLVRWMDVDIPVGVLASNEEVFDQVYTFELPHGYNSASISGFYLTGSGYTRCTISKCKISANAILWSVRNMGNEDTGSLTLTISVMLVKSAV